MVWIHGGGNTIGTGGTYGTIRNLVEQQHVVAVTLNYRLGLLGWFRHPALHGADATPDDLSGNYGTLDLIAALAWVKDNIAAFGGDPNNVTIFGESAGAFDVFSLLLAPKAKGLFHRAISQSGVVGLRTVAEAEHFTDDAEPGLALSSAEVLVMQLLQDGKAKDRAQAKALLAAMKPDEVATYLRSKTPEQLLGSLNGSAFGMYSAPALLRDGVVLPDRPAMEVFSEGAFNRVPVLLGTNRDEYRLFQAFNPKYVTRTFGVPVVREPKRYVRDAALVSDFWRAVGAHGPAVALSSVMPGQVFVYRFDWDEEPSRLGFDVSFLLGAAHGLEISFVLNDIDGEFDPFGIAAEGNKAGRVVVSNAMSRAWASFARDGNPGADWPAFSAAEPKLLVFDTPAPRVEQSAMTPEDLETRVWSDGAPDEQCEAFAKLFFGFGRGAGTWTPARAQTFATKCSGMTLAQALERK